MGSIDRTCANDWITETQLYDLWTSTSFSNVNHRMVVMTT